MGLYLILANKFQQTQVTCPDLRQQKIAVRSSTLKRFLQQLSRELVSLLAAIALVDRNLLLLNSGGNFSAILREKTRRKLDRESGTFLYSIVFSFLCPVSFVLRALYFRIPRMVS